METKHQTTKPEKINVLIEVDYGTNITDWIFIVIISIYVGLCGPGTQDSRVLEEVLTAID